MQKNTTKAGGYMRIAGGLLVIAGAISLIFSKSESLSEGELLYWIVIPVMFLTGGFMIFEGLTCW